MTCNKNCIHYPVCELKKYEFANIDECQYYEEPISQGEWIDVNGDGSLWKCSNCGETSCCRGKYCSDCGADMREAGNDL